MAIDPNYLQQALQRYAGAGSATSAVPMTPTVAPATIPILPETSRSALYSTQQPGIFDRFNSALYGSYPGDLSGTPIRMGNTAATNTAVGGAGTTATATGGGGTGATPMLPDYSQLQNIINQINASNQQATSAAQDARIRGAPQLEERRSAALGILADQIANPNDPVYRTNPTNAARVLATGTGGSEFGNVTGYRLSREQWIEDQQRFANLIGADYAQHPQAPIADPQALYQYQLGLMNQNQQRGLDRDLQMNLANLELANRYLYGQRNRGGSYGGGYGPRLPTDYGDSVAAAQQGFQANIPTPITTTEGSPGGYGELVMYDTPTGAPENWWAMTPEQRVEYNAAIATNPYYGLPDWMNPYSGDENPYE